MTQNQDFAAAEKQFLDKVYHTYTVDTSAQTMAMRKLLVRTFQPYLNGGRGLELGCSDGFITEMLSQRLDHLDVVDGSKKFLEEARKRNLPNVQFIESLFEEFTTTIKYDHVF